MADNNQNSKVTKGVKNVVYSVLVFFASMLIGIVVLDPSSLDSKGSEPEFGRGAFLAVGLSLVITIVFSMWFSQKNKNRY